MFTLATSNGNSFSAPTYEDVEKLMGLYLANQDEIDARPSRRIASDESGETATPREKGPNEIALLERTGKQRMKIMDKAWEGTREEYAATRLAELGDATATNAETVAEGDAY